MPVHADAPAPSRQPPAPVDELAAQLLRRGNTLRLRARGGCCWPYSLVPSMPAGSRGWSTSSPCCWSIAAAISRERSGRRCGSRSTLYLAHVRRLRGVLGVAALGLTGGAGRR